MSPQKRAVLYARVSTPRQAELYSLDYQIQQEQAYVADADLHVVAELRDDQSGRKIERDGLEEACQMLERDEADVLITWKFDRLHRNYVNSVLLRDRIRRAGKEIHYAQSRTVSGKTARERLPEDLQFIMAEIDADDIIERTTQGKRNKIKSGKWLGLNRAPYGYKTIGHGKDVTLEIDEETAAIIRQIFLWYVHGEGKEGPLTTFEIVEKLTALGIPTPWDDLPNPTSRKKYGYGRWNRSTIYKILHQSAYNGTFYHYRYHMVNGVKQFNHNQEDWIGVPVPRMVDAELFEAAKLKLNQGRNLSARGAQTEYLFGRRIYCECGYKMRSRSTTKPYRIKAGSTKDYTYRFYQCPGRRGGKEVVNRCDMPTIRIDKLDARVWQWVKEEIANPAILERKLREIQAGQREGQSGFGEKIQTLVIHREEIEDELRKLGKLYTTDMPRHIIEGLISEQSTKLQLMNEEIRKLEEERKTPLTDDTIATLVAFSMEFAEHLSAIGERFEAKRVVVDGLDVKVKVVRKNGELWLELTSILRPNIISAILFTTS